MKKLLSLTFGLLFLFSIQALPCDAEFACADGSRITCEGNSTCHAGIGYVYCTNTDGTFSSSDC
ncbi:hypothetical protein [Algoriphagus algorifonticola]|uniref:hypothetical protein n=1 Tax=Algoriphagus algorifonticola TaxID=2593007 RepID=UPI00119FD74D|nr:hypothetical protein [Algoriphagus algorifonticola]